MPIANLDAYKQHRYQQLLQLIRQTQAQMRSLRFTLQRTIPKIVQEAQFIQEVAALTDGDYVLPAADSPRKEEILPLIKALLSYAHYAGYLTAQQYQALTGDQNPIPPDQINANIDAWIAD